MEDAILTKDLRKAYGKVQALDGLDLRVGRGTIFGLLGPNGAGKSTTVRVLTTLTRPDSGSARVADIDVLAEPRRVRAAIGVVGPGARGALERVDGLADVTADDGTLRARARDGGAAIPALLAALDAHGIPVVS